MKTKTCTSCGKDKAASKFQVRRASKDGLTARCKKCLSNYDKSRANEPHRVEARKAYLKTEAGKSAATKAKKRYIERSAIKRGAHVIVGNAIRDGRLIRMPCEICGSVSVHAHHDDYAKPLEVRWLCPKHHKQWHDENGEGLNAM
jgi:transposase-like protein